MEYEENEPAISLESMDPVVRRGELLANLAAQVDETENEEARHYLLDFMALTIRTIAVEVQRGQIVSFDGGKVDD